MGSTDKNVVPSLGMVYPGLEQKSGSIGRGTLGSQTIVSVRLGPAKLIDNTTYKIGLFVAPVDNCYIVDAWLTSVVPAAGGTNTLAISNYDKSATTARNVLSTTNIDPTVLTLNQGLQLTLSTTVASLMMDQGDLLNCTLVTGNPMTTDGEGYVLTVVINVPNE